LTIILRLFLGSWLGWLSETSWWRLIKDHVFLLDILGLVLASSPAVAPVAYQEFEAKCVNLHTRLKTDAKVPKIHLIFVRVSQEKTEVACNGKKQVVIEGGEVREFFDKKLGDFF
jgi:hypothetical protein